VRCMARAAAGATLATTKKTTLAHSLPVHDDDTHTFALERIIRTPWNSQ